MEDQGKKYEVDIQQAYNGLLQRFADVSSEAVLKEVLLGQLQGRVATLEKLLDEPCAAECCQPKDNQPGV